MTYIQPLLLIFLATAVIGLARLRNCKGSLLPILAVTVLSLISWPPVDWLLSRPFEARYTIRALPFTRAQAIVVLSSAVSPPMYERPYPLPDAETYQRCAFAAWLHRHWEPLPVLACGGPERKRQLPAAAGMREVLQKEGVPETLIWTEERSHSTYENAVFGANILRSHGIDTIALVVEARSMPRAEACFRKQGIRVVPAPCEFREFERGLDEFIPSWKAIQSNEQTLHEALGFTWYWLRGWI